MFQELQSSAWTSTTLYPFSRDKEEHARISEVPLAAPPNRTLSVSHHERVGLNNYSALHLNQLFSCFWLKYSHIAGTKEALWKLHAANLSFMITEKPLGGSLPSCASPSAEDSTLAKLLLLLLEIVQTSVLPAYSLQTAL